MQYDSEFHHRRSMRLEGYDYSSAGAYFVTICIQNRACLLGEVVENSMVLSPGGEMVLRWWNELLHKFPRVDLDAFAVMPDHVHGIIVICDRAEGTGRHDDADLPGLVQVIDWFKTMTTNEYIRGVRSLGWVPFNKRFWQRGYYDRIIQDENELDRVRNYIVMNPARWDRT